MDPLLLGHQVCQSKQIFDKLMEGVHMLTIRVNQLITEINCPVIKAPNNW